MNIPDIRFANSDGIDIAYQEFGSGVPLVVVPPLVSNIEIMWEEPSAARFLRRLGSFCRVVHFDKRGMGMSERSIGNPTLEQRIDDLRAVMDAVGMEQAYISGLSEGGLMAAYFAATHPERVLGLVLYGTTARMAPDDDYPLGLGDRDFETTTDGWAGVWGTAESVTTDFYAPSKANDPEFRRWMNRYERTTVSPRGLAAMLRLNRSLDIRQVLPSIAAPTLVVHRVDDMGTPVEMGRCVAEHIPNAKWVELPGYDHFPWVGDAEPFLDEIEEFVTGHRRSEVETDRILATVLFTDIVGSTERAAALGDRRWRAVLDDLDDLTNRQLERLRGRLVKSTGDAISRCSTGQRARSGARLSSARRRVHWISSCGPACTPAKWSYAATTSVASACTSVRASVRLPERTRCSCRAQSPISSPARESNSSIAESTTSKASPDGGESSQLPLARPAVAGGYRDMAHLVREAVSQVTR